MTWFLPVANELPLVLAYLDPGSGSLLLQVLIAGMFSSLFFFKSSLVTVRTSVGRIFKRHA
ncbi:hypothetical protein Sinac_7571 (plasmid) [Singulisphaera acidiphila DSM 18658]|uniref:Uncharacterized protein n=1 Tax=Singulisphaera acidiphila (strain ATCC BAA-1392 / DSM 18658 / VKM B-2454 / MOB10) TaxID=886293 RepID=L0DRF1_SINAD|nr:hypothetical protein Sinac_7571 [Singulisphaera acidiphila DSM 18658]